MKFPKSYRTGEIVFRVENLSKGFGSQPLFRELDFSIERGQRWAIVGPNGCGKTTLLKCLLGELEPDTGKVIHGQGLKTGYFDQQLHIVDDDMSVVDAVRPPKKIIEERERRNLLGAFGLTGDQQLQTVGSLSGGQRCRAALAKLAADDPNVLVLDEPTNHLDLWARAALEKAVNDFDGTVLFISHDRYFVDKVADHLLIIQPDGRFKVLDGNYSTFRMLVGQGLFTDPFTGTGKEPPVSAGGNTKQPIIQQPPAAAGNSLKNKDKQKKKRKFPYRKLSDIEDEIFARENWVQTLNEDLLRPEIVRDAEKMKAVHLEIQKEQEKLKQLNEHWEEATEMNW